MMIKKKQQHLEKRFYVKCKIKKIANLIFMQLLFPPKTKKLTVNNGSLPRSRFLGCHATLHMFV